MDTPANANPADLEYVYGYSGNLGHVTPCRDEDQARREAALLHGQVWRRPVAGSWERVE